MPDTKAPDHPKYKEGQHYVMAPWREFTDYACMKCQYSSLWFAKLVKHLDRGVHKWAFPRTEVTPPEPKTNKYGDIPY